ncbi:hypothetical protein GLA29479_3808 [Lysobacter antibioticus]|nr:hypothetical protein GLA29479_3808 [Lysobacter antibioticus]
MYASVMAEAWIAEAIRVYAASGACVAFGCFGWSRLAPLLP